MIKVLLADDHAIFRGGVAKLLDSEDGIEVVGEVGDGDGVLGAVAEFGPDIVLLDLSLPGMSGMEILRELQKHHVRVGVVILTMYPEHNFATYLIDQGAGAYITKSASPTVLVEAIRKVASVGVYMTPGVRELDEARGAGATGSPHDRLSPRETEVFLQLIEGKAVSEIAYALDVRVSTVSTLVKRIRDKLGAESIGDLLLYAHRMGLLQ
jgi:two-component system, NarL family, invasion response regulator UvrY